MTEHTHLWEMDADDRIVCACGERYSPRETTDAEKRDFWFGSLQEALEELIASAPDETCRTIAEGFLKETYEFTDD